MGRVQGRDSGGCGHLNNACPAQSSGSQAVSPQGPLPNPQRQNNNKAGRLGVAARLIQSPRPLALSISAENVRVFNASRTRFRTNQGNR